MFIRVTSHLPAALLRNISKVIIYGGGGVAYSQFFNPPIYIMKVTIYPAVLPQKNSRGHNYKVYCLVLACINAVIHRRFCSDIANI